MKKIVLILFLFIASHAVNAQGSISSLKSKIAKSESDLQNPSRAAKYSTWLKNASLYADIAEANTSGFISQIPISQLYSMVGKPSNANAPEVASINEKSYNVFSYPSVDIYVDATNTVKFFVETVNPMPDALLKAEKAVLQAYKIDPRSKDKAIDLLNRIISIYTVSADNLYNIAKYELAAAAFFRAGVISANPMLESISTDDLLYFAAASYVAAAKLAEAKPAVDMLIERNYLRDGQVLYYKGIVEAAIGNNVDAEAAFIKGVQLFPENTTILNNLIGFYIDNKEDPKKVIPFIKRAQINNPDNAVLYLAEGIAYDQINDIPNSIIAFKISTEKDPSNFETFYNLGLAYYRQSASISEELLDIDYTQAELYNKKQVEIDAVQMLSLEALLKAHAIDEIESQTIELIRSIYFRQRNKSPEMMEQYNIFDAKSKK